MEKRKRWRHLKRTPSRLPRLLAAVGVFLLLAIVPIVSASVTQKAELPPAVDVVYSPMHPTYSVAVMLGKPDKPKTDTHWVRWAKGWHCQACRNRHAVLHFARVATLPRLPRKSASTTAWKRVGMRYRRLAHRYAKLYSKLYARVIRRLQQEYRSFGQEIVAYAKNFLGVPYVWGGESPGGFDCSGLVAYVFGHFGISLPHLASAQQVAGAGVSLSGLSPGDLVFFGYPAYHVGIYIGGGEMIDAPYTGAVVRIDNVGSPSSACHLGR